MIPNEFTFREEVRDLETKARVSDSSIHALKEQISYLKTKCKETDRLHDEIDRLKNKLKHMENVELVISGSVDEVEDMLRLNHSTEQLCMLVSTLKRYVVIILQLSGSYFSCSSENLFNFKIRISYLIFSPLQFV